MWVSNFLFWFLVLFVWQPPCLACTWQCAGQLHLSLLWLLCNVRGSPRCLWCTFWILFRNLRLVSLFFIHILRLELWVCSSGRRGLWSLFAVLPRTPFSHQALLKELPFLSLISIWVTRLLIPAAQSAFHASFYPQNAHVVSLLLQSARLGVFYFLQLKPLGLFVGWKTDLQCFWIAFPRYSSL